MSRPLKQQADVAYDCKTYNPLDSESTISISIGGISNKIGENLVLKLCNRLDILKVEGIFRFTLTNVDLDYNSSLNLTIGVYRDENHIDPAYIKESIISGLQLANTNEIQWIVQIMFTEVPKLSFSQDTVRYYFSVVAELNGVSESKNAVLLLNQYSFNGLELGVIGQSTKY